MALPRLADRTPEPTPPYRTVRDRDRLRLIVVGYAACILLGLGLAYWIQHEQDWHAGLSWERDWLLRVHAHRFPALVEQLLYAIPWLGTNLTLFPIAAVVSLVLGWRRRRWDLAAWIMSVAVGCLSLNWLLKHLTMRERPDLWERVGWYGWGAYPSGHAMISIALLGTFALILRCERGWRWPAWIVPVVAGSIFYSRMYHGVHWPTDLIAGAAIGILWLWITAQVFRRRPGTCEG